MLCLKIPRRIVSTGIVKGKILCHRVVFASRVFFSCVHDSPMAFLEQRLGLAWFLADVPKKMHSIPTPARMIFRKCYHFGMDLDGIIQELKQERARIDHALSALEQLTPGIKKSTPRIQAAVSNGAGKKRRTMSAAARKAIGDAQRKRWAKQRKA